MKRNTLPTLFIVSSILIFIGAFFIVMHYPMVPVIMGAGLLLYLIYIIAAIIEVANSSKSGTEKLLWILGLIFVSFITSILYLIIGRKDRVAFS